jgi:tetratricopeptide (TPR) repeat protein
VRNQSSRTEDAYALVVEGAVHLAAQNTPAAFAALERSLSIARSLELPLIEGRAEAELARAHHASGDPRAAAALLDHALAHFQATESVWGLALVATYRGTVAADTGALSQGIAYYQEAVELARESGAEHLEARAREGIARCRALLGAG